MACKLQGLPLLIFFYWFFPGLAQLPHMHALINTQLETRGNPLKIDQEAHSSACWRPPSNDITGDVSSDLTGVCMSPGVLTYSGHPHTALCNTQVMFGIATFTQVGMCSIWGCICSILSQEMYSILQFTHIHVKHLLYSQYNYKLP